MVQPGSRPTLGQMRVLGDPKTPPIAASMASSVGGMTGVVRLQHVIPGWVCGIAPGHKQWRGDALGHSRLSGTPLIPPRSCVDEKAGRQGGRNGYLAASPLQPACVPTLGEESLSPSSITCPCWKERRIAQELGEDAPRCPEVDCAVVLPGAQQYLGRPVRQERTRGIGGMVGP